MVEDDLALPWKEDGGVFVKPIEKWEELLISRVAENVDSSLLTTARDFSLSKSERGH